MSLEVVRGEAFLRPNPNRLLLRAFDTSGPEQARNVLSRALAIPETEVLGLVGGVLEEFGNRRQGLRASLLARFAKIWHLLPTDQELSEERQILIASYFCSEYAIESAALSNPSIVAHPDQKGVPEGSLRVILSLRATGEGHISSITFRTGLADPQGRLKVDLPSPFVVEPEIIPNPLFHKGLFRRKMSELGLANAFTLQVVDGLAAHFPLSELRLCFETETLARRRSGSMEESDAITEAKVLSLALSNYEVQFLDSGDISQRIIFPVTPSQSNGIEDARFVRFQDDEGSSGYFATYTAYDGRLVLPQLIETKDFQRFRFSTLNGPAVKNKGMALFPRKIRGSYAMLSRQDSENIHLMFSDNPHFWHKSEVIIRPKFPWELVQIGNCGSPLETKDGWLVISHGVGPARKYCLGAFLLDLEQPSKVLGRLRTPLLVPLEEERTGYLPNVVYSCGSLIHNGTLVLPYGISDYATRFATVDVASLLAAME